MTSVTSVMWERQSRPAPALQRRVPARTGLDRLGRALLPALGAVLIAVPAWSASIAEQPVNENDYIIAKSCIALSEIKQTIVIDERHIVLVLRRGHYMLNQMRQSCQNLNSDSVLGFSTNGSSLCDLDHMEVSDRASMSRIGSCNLGRFEAISKEQMIAIRQSMRQQRGVRN